MESLFVKYTLWHLRMTLLGAEFQRNKNLVTYFYFVVGLGKDKNTHIGVQSFHSLFGN